MGLRDHYEREIITTDEARSLLRDRSFRFGRRGSRIHPEAQELVSLEIRSIDGICGRCSHLVVMKGQDPHLPHLTNVYLSCKAPYDPVELYRNTDLFSQAECDGFTPLKKE